MFTVQSSGCAPVVRAFEQGTGDRAGVGIAADRRVGTARAARHWRPADADGPAATSRGGAIAVTKRRSSPRCRPSSSPGQSTPFRERRGDARPPHAPRNGTITSDEVVVVFSTGGNKYR